MVRHSYGSTAGYRARIDQAGVDPTNISSLTEFQAIPSIGKESIRDNLDHFSVNLPQRSYITTGGSTGLPFGFYRDRDSFAKELASKAHQYRRIGWREGDRQIVFRGIPINSQDNMEFVPEFNELRCSSYYLMPECMENYRQAAWQYRPDWIRTYPSSGVLFADWLLASGREFPPVKGILCASENLYRYQMETMQKAFPGARVFSHYGHYELAVLAGYCEHTDNYHVLPQYGYAELLDVNGKQITERNQIGEIVASSFIMHATPFLRYRTQDYAVFRGFGCQQCGRPCQVWERIEGRLQEFIITGNGRMISMTAMNFHDDIFDRIRQFQFYQCEKGKITLRYIPKENCLGSDLLRIQARLVQKLGSDVALKLERVKEISLTQRGKHRFLIQELPLAKNDAAISLTPNGRYRFIND
jgi:phenylacetate-CoA ligase